MAAVHFPQILWDVRRQKFLYQIHGFKQVDQFLIGQLVCSVTASPNIYSCGSSSPQIEILIYMPDLCKLMLHKTLILDQFNLRSLWSSLELNDETRTTARQCQCQAQVKQNKYKHNMIISQYGLHCYALAKGSSQKKKLQI